MTTKNIKKILLNKDRNNFVVDTENIVRSVNNVPADENGNVSITSVANATNADNATNLGGYLATDYIKSVNGATPDDSGNVTINAGGVKTVNSIAPDAGGNVMITADSLAGSTVSLKGTRSSTGTWTITGLTPYKPLLLLYSTRASDGYSDMMLINSISNSTPPISYLSLSRYTEQSAIFIPTDTTVSMQISQVKYGPTLYVYQ